MSVNLRFAMDPSKTKKFGPLFHTIDFESNRYYPLEEFKDSSTNLNAGTIIIGGKSYKVTYKYLCDEIYILTAEYNRFSNRNNPISEMHWKIQGRSWTLTKSESRHLLSTFEKAKRLIEIKFRLGC